MHQTKCSCSNRHCKTLKINLCILTEIKVFSLLFLQPLKLKINWKHNVSLSFLDVLIALIQLTITEIAVKTELGWYFLSHGWSKLAKPIKLFLFRSFCIIRSSYLVQSAIYFQNTAGKFIVNKSCSGLNFSEQNLIQALLL